MSHAVVMAADYGYINQLETMVKSLIYHNHDLTIYIFNSDIPQEWFAKMNDYYHYIGITIHDQKVDPNLLDKPVSRSHITTMTYARLLIPKAIQEDRILYLDSDMIVNGPIKELFNLDMQGYVLGAVPDYVDDQTFNAGVLLLDNQKLKKDPEISDKWLKEADDGTANDDQTILNNHYKDHYLHLPDTYNIGIGLQAGFYYYNHDLLKSFNDRLESAKPFKIIHYETNDKPWNLTSSSSLRELWWQYFALEPEEIINHQALPQFMPKSTGNVFTMTASADVKNLESLIKTLPNITFHIAAYSYMNFQLLNLLKHPNVRLYPNVIGSQLDHIQKIMNVYLDINYGPKDNDMIKYVQSKKIPILSFQEVANNDAHYDRYHIFGNDDVNGMAAQIRNLVRK